MIRSVMFVFVFVFASVATFGQSPWEVKSLPYSLNGAKNWSAGADFGLPTSKSLENGFLSTNGLSGSNDQNPFGLNDFRKSTRVVLPVKVARGPWKMPIADLSTGYTSNLPIKRSLGDFSSPMPMVREKPTLPESGSRYSFEGNPQLFPGGSEGASVLSPGK